MMGRDGWQDQERGHPWAKQRLTLHVSLPSSLCLHQQHILQGARTCAKGQWLWTGKWGCDPHPPSLLFADEFPESLLILNLTGNSCTNQDGYR